MKKYLENQGGYIFLLTMFLSIVLTMMVGTVCTLTLTNYKEQIHTRRNTQAFYIAESGLSMAKYTLCELSQMPGDNHEYPEEDPWLQSDSNDFAPGNYYQVWADGDSSTKLIITSKGIAENRERVLQIEARVISASPMFPRGIVETLPERPYYYGDEDGADGDHDGDDSDYEPYRWNPYYFQPPTGLPSEGTLTGGSISGNHKYSGIDLGNRDVLTINGPAEIFIDGDIGMGNGSTLVIQGSGEVIIYLTGDLDAKNGSSFDLNQPLTLSLQGEAVQNVSFNNSFTGNGATSKYFLIYSATDGYDTEPAYNNIEINFKNKSNSVVGIFAPNSHVAFNGSSNFDERIVGSVVAREISAGGHDVADYIVYDESLESLGYSYSSVEIQEETWRETD